VATLCTLNEKNQKNRIQIFKIVFLFQNIIFINPGSVQKQCLETFQWPEICQMDKKISSSKKCKISFGLFFKKKPRVKKSQKLQIFPKKAKLATLLVIHSKASFRCRVARHLRKKTNRVKKPNC